MYDCKTISHSYTWRTGTCQIPGDEMGKHASCQDPGMDLIEFYLQVAQTLQLRKCTFRKMARSRPINLESVIALQDSQLVTIGMERTRKDQAKHQSGSRSYLQPILLTPLEMNSHIERSNSLTFLIHDRTSSQLPPEAPQPPRQYLSRKHLLPSRFM